MLDAVDADQLVSHLWRVARSSLGEERTELAQVARDRECSVAAQDLQSREVFPVSEKVEAGVVLGRCLPGTLTEGTLCLGQEVAGGGAVPSEAPCED